MAIEDRAPQLLPDAEESEKDWHDPLDDDEAVAAAADTDADLHADLAEDTLDEGLDDDQTPTDEHQTQTVEPQDEGQVAQPPAKDKAPEHPDDLDLTELDSAAFKARVLELFEAGDEDAVRRHMLRDKDYRQKTQQVAAKTREVEQEREAIEREKAAMLTQAPPQAAPDQQKPTSGMTLQEFSTDFQARTGQPPTYADYADYQTGLLRDEFEAKMTAAVAPVLEHQREAEAQARAQRFRSQWDALAREYPEATEPGMLEQVAKYLDTVNAPVYDGDVETAFMAVAGKKLLAARTKRTEAARTSQVTARQAAPSVPPGGPDEFASAVVSTSNLDAIVAAQKKDPGLLAQLRAFGRR